MSNSRSYRRNSDPLPPITIEDTALGAPPQIPPSPVRMSFRDSKPGSSTDPPADNFLREGRRGTFGHKRKHSPNIEWHQKWTKDTWKQGRVLLIDYVAKEHENGRRKIVAQEFSDIDGLRRFYRKPDLSGQAALRVIHVQNATWATRFLLRKFNIDASDDLVGTSFARWARYERPQQRGGKPVLNGRTFRAQRDPWRSLSRTAFGCDYLKHYPKHTVIPSPTGMKPMMELNHYDAHDQPRYGYDVYAQRLSVYIQLSDGKPGQVVDEDIPNPYNEEAYEDYQRLKKQYGNVDANENPERYIPKLKTLDNQSTIIIFETSQSGSVRDTLIGARQELESRWRRLTFYLPKDDISNDETLAVECMDFILKDIFKALAYNWERFLGVVETHVDILEDKIYENPADESRAPELWKNSAQWLKVERLLYMHADIVREMRSYLHDLAQADPKEAEPWLSTAVEEVEKFTGQWERDVIAPTTALSDLMYKSVGIRDARHSLQLGLSMWRLSWITFIFLPLTFTVGFFGMNVDTFKDDPSIKWWFVTSVPILLIVLFLWYAIKHTLDAQRQNPLRRGVYEALYYELATNHANLWTRTGPRSNLVTIGWWNSLKWRMATTWFGNDKLKGKSSYDPATEEFGAWSRLKRYLVRRWLAEITVLESDSLPHVEQPPGAIALTSQNSSTKDFGAVGELLSIATPVAIAELDPTAASRLHSRITHNRLRSLSPRRSDGSAGRPTSEGGMSGVMVEEEKPSEDERSGDEIERWRKKKLSVPFETSR